MNRKKQKQLPKLLFKKSLSGSGIVDPKKVRLVLAYLQKSKGTNLKNLLTGYKNIIQAKLEKEEVIVETPSTIAYKKNIEKRLLEKTGAKKVSYVTNSNLIFGARIKHGDWIWEDTLDSKLEQIKSNL